VGRAVPQGALLGKERGANTNTQAATETVLGSIDLPLGLSIAFISDAITWSSVTHFSASVTSLPDLMSLPSSSDLQRCRF
jgi:hypothetical protein